ncbi:MAG: tetraacyldisaccharide 4'-kinase [Rhodanobacter sp.]
MALRDTLDSAWYHAGPIPWWTGPLAALYGTASGLRRWLFRHGWLRSQRLAVPVIVVGNINAGGTGKTPLTIALADELRRRGYTPGVVSRGYGGTQRAPVLLDADPDPAVVGDEPCLIRASGTPVAIGRDRPAAARLLIDAGCDVVVADDGLQHYRLARDVEICVIDGTRRFGNERLLPAGPLREPLRRLRCVDLRVCNGGVPAPGEFPMALRGDVAINLRDARERLLEDFVGARVHAVAAIGHPQRFFDSLRSAGLEPIEHRFDDHHRFVAGELTFTPELPLLMTDKDAIKCRHFAQANWWRVPVSAQLPEEFFGQLLQCMNARADRAPPAAHRPR